MGCWLQQLAIVHRVLPGNYVVACQIKPRILKLGISTVDLCKEVRGQHKLVIKRCLQGQGHL